jgi:hypothetical protein
MGGLKKLFTSLSILAPGLGYFLSKQRLNENGLAFQLKRIHQPPFVPQLTPADEMQY